MHRIIVYYTMHQITVVEDEDFSFEVYNEPEFETDFYREKIFELNYNVDEFIEILKNKQIPEKFIRNFLYYDSFLNAFRDINDGFFLRKSSSCFTEKDFNEYLVKRESIKIKQYHFNKEKDEITIKNVRKLFQFLYDNLQFDERKFNDLKTKGRTTLSHIIVKENSDNKNFLRLKIFVVPATCHTIRFLNLILSDDVFSPTESFKYILYRKFSNFKELYEAYENDYREWERLNIMLTKQDEKELRKILRKTYFYKKHNMNQYNLNLKNLLSCLQNFKIDNKDSSKDFINYLVIKDGLNYFGDKIEFHAIQSILAQIHIETLLATLKQKEE